MPKAPLPPLSYWLDRDPRGWGKRETMPNSTLPPKLEALVYDILPSVTAVFSYVIDS